jgi:hypothetical protein
MFSHQAARQYLLSAEIDFPQEETTCPPVHWFESENITLD